MEKQTKLQEKAIDEIIKRYGEIIDLKKSPYIIVEIVKQYQHIIDGGIVEECLPPGGPPKRGDEVILLNKILKQVSALTTNMDRLSKEIKDIGR